ncbi:hypothetical protein [Pyrobaculum genetic element 1]|nr:hypothetical protein [Pyrobaculum genetic element 1]
MGIVSYKPLSAEFFYNTFASIASGNLYDIFHHENPIFDITLSLINLTVTDYAFITIARDGMRIPVRNQYPTWDSGYSYEMKIVNSASDHLLVCWSLGSATVIGSEGVDLADYHYLFGLSASGSTFKAYRAWVTAKTIASQTARFTVTDTNYASGYPGIGFVSGGHQHYLTMTYFLPPFSQAPQAVALIEYEVVGDGTLNEPFRPLFPQEFIEIRPSDVSSQEWDAVKHNIKGRNGHSIVDRLAITWGAVDFRADSSGKPVAPTVLVAVFDQRSDRVVRHINHARGRNKHVYKAPFDTKLHYIYVTERRDRDWLITENELAYQLLGREDLEVVAVADFYEREIADLGRVKPSPVVEYVINMWRDRAQRTGRSDAEEKLRRVLKRI